MNINYYKSKLKQNSPKQIFLKANKKLLRETSNFFKSKKDFLIDSRNIFSSYYIENSFINPLDLDVSFIDSKISSYLINRYLNHEFDLLGSGWIKVSYDVTPSGGLGHSYPSYLNLDFDRKGNWLSSIIPSSYLEKSKSLWKLVSLGYEPIDWGLDFKSGYRFSEKVWYKNQPIGKSLGVDIKVPWELMRMQHLLQLSIFTLSNKEYKDRIILEFKNEVLDFLSANPIRFGADWTCTMDVGIRISNILLSFDILSRIDDKCILDEAFNEILASSVYEHGKFITENLEWNKNGVVGNHYLFDVLGLLFVSSYLNSTEEVNSWFVFAIQEIISCFKEQFNFDGSNFEASTSYHRLSGELIVFSTAFIYGILKTSKRDAFFNFNPKAIKRLKPLNEQEFDLNSEEFFPSWYIERMGKLSKFSYDITKPNKNIAQIGDNDSGRFLKLTPVGDFLKVYDAKKLYENLKDYNYLKDNDIFFDENILNHESFIAALDGLFKNKLLDSKEYSLEESFIKVLSKNKILNNSFNDKYPIKKSSFNKDFKYFIKSKISFSDYNLKNIHLEKLKTYGYDDFGLYIIKSEEFFLSFMIGPVGQKGNGGHGHLDKLSFELNVHGVDLFLDGGTFLYTPIPELRDEFRSIKFHNVPYIEGENVGEFNGSFSMKAYFKCSLLEFDNKKVKALLNYKNTEILREIEVFSDKIVIKDYSNKPIKVNFNKRCSNGYGKLYCS